MRYKIFLCTAFLASSVSAGRAQDSAQVKTVQAKGSPMLIEQHRLTNPYFNAGNAASMMFGERLYYSEISLGMEISNGSFHRPQQPENFNRYLFSAEGSVDLGRVYAIGGFDFKQAYENKTGFNSIFDPYRGTPYIIADATGGDWRKQSYDMWTKMATPIVGDALFVGVRAGLTVNRGAKKIDPRPQANTNNIEFAPSLTWKIDNRNALGGYFGYTRFRETSNLLLYDTGNPQKLYLLKGMGQYVYENFNTVNLERRYAGEELGGGFDYSFTAGRFSVVLSGAGRNYVEDATDTRNNRPKLVGRLYGIEYDLSLNLSVRGDRAFHGFNVFYNTVERSGREIIQTENTSSNVNSWVTIAEAPRRSVVTNDSFGAKYSLLLKPHAEGYYLWRISLGSVCNNFSDTYKVMDSYVKYKSIMNTLAVERIIPAQKYFFKIGVNGSFRNVWGNVLNYTLRETSDATIQDGLIKPDYLITTSDYFYGAANLTCGYKLRNNNSLWLKVAYGHLKSNNNLKLNDLSISFGYTF